MVLFFLILICIIIISIFVIINSSFKLSINKLLIDTENKQLEYELKFGLYFMKKIRIIGIKINKKKVKKIKRLIKNSEKSKTLKFISNISKINIKKLSSNIEEKLKEKLKKQIIKRNFKPIEFVRIVLKNLKLETLKYKMNLKIGIDDAFFNSILIAGLSTIISILLKLTVNNIKKADNYFYEVIPVYGNKNVVKLNLSCIINIKLVHIINIIYIVYKKGRSDKYVRTSNRRSYDYCNE